MKLSVLVPVYNEERTLQEIVRRVCDFQIPKEIILVDDGSEDQSRTILTRLQEENARANDPLNQIKVFFQPVNQGKGAAIKTALSHVTGDIVLVQDADLEYDPKDYPSLLAPIQAGQADVVYGTRFYGGGAHRVLFFWHYMGNLALTLMSNMLTNLNLSDMEVGYKAFRAEAVKGICPNGVDVSFECVGHPGLIRQSIDLLDWGGTCVILGVPKLGTEADFMVASMYNDKTIMGCRYGLPSDSRVLFSRQRFRPSS